VAQVIVVETAGEAQNLRPGRDFKFKPALLLHLSAGGWNPTVVHVVQIEIEICHLVWLSPEIVRKGGPALGEILNNARHIVAAAHRPVISRAIHVAIKRAVPEIRSEKSAPPRIPSKRTKKIGQIEYGHVL